MGDPLRELRFDETLTVRRPNRALVALASLPLVIACALLAAALVRLDGTAVMFVPHLLALGATALWTVLRQRPYARHTLEPLRVDASTLHLGDARVRLAEIPRALYLPVSASGHELVRVERRRRPAVELIVNDRAQAERLLAALGHAPGQRVATFRAHSRLATTPWRFAAIAAFVGVGVAHGVGLLPAPSIVALLVAGLGLFAAPTAVEVGADGVLLRWLGTRRFVPVANVQRVERFNEGFGNNRRVGVRLHLSGGLTEQLAFGLASSANDEVTAFGV